MSPGATTAQEGSPVMERVPRITDHLLLSRFKRRRFEAVLCVYLDKFFFLEKFKS